MRFLSAASFISSVRTSWRSLRRNIVRLFPGNEVRLMNAYFVTCTGFEKDENGKVTVVHCTYDPETKAETAPDGRKVKGTIHWVSAARCQ